nr:alpha/beta hydrolase [Candidatus Cloacimonadota bacterium]
MDLTKFHKPFSHCSESKVGVLVIHGITSTISSMEYLAKRFADAGYNVELPGLTGHGTIWQDMQNLKYTDWVDDLENSLKKLNERCSKIFLCGLSLGGGLALYLSGKHPEITGTILINHASKFTNPKFWFVPILRKIFKSVPAVASDIASLSLHENLFDPLL